MKQAKIHTNTKKKTGRVSLLNNILVGSFINIMLYTQYNPTEFAQTLTLTTNTRNVLADGSDA